MGRPRRFAVGLAVSLYAIANIGTSPERPVKAEERVPPWEHETPQRMCVGMLKEGAVVSYTSGQETNSYTNEEHDTLKWFHGDLAAGRISTWDVPSSMLAGRGSTALRRWYWEQGRLWFALESLYGSFGPYFAELLRAKAHAEIDGAALPAANADDTEPDSDRRVLTEKCMTDGRPLKMAENVESLSRLRPLRVEAGAVHPIRADWNHDRDLGLFGHRTGGFDLIPHALDHWTLFMGVRHTMQIWDCRSKRVATDEGEQIQNTWTLVTELWVPWTGQFFVFERSHLGEYLLVRDCGEVHLLRLEGNPRRQRPKLDQGAAWRGRQLLDPVDYLIALIYIEPENTVYGFGPNFYVRLAKTEPPGPLNTPRLEKKPCRDVTKGKAIWTDDDGKSHELGEPFRTIWQCANVLKEDGVLEAAAEPKPEGQEVMPSTAQ